MQATPISADERRFITEITSALQLKADQVEELRDLLDERRQRLDSLEDRINQLDLGAPESVQLKTQLDRERRAALEQLLPALSVEQQTKLRAMLNPPAAANAPPSTVAAIKPVLPDGPLSAKERLIDLPKYKANKDSMSGPKPGESLGAINEEQKILHFLNRAGFGPRPGDIERIKQIGLNRYLEQQLLPEEITDELLSRPLESLTTLQMTTPEVIQNFAPPLVPVRPQPTPKPTPATPTIKEGGDPEQNTAAMGNAKKGADPEMQSMMDEAPANQRERRVRPAPTPTPAPARQTARRRDSNTPLRELQQAKLLRAIFSEKQLQEVMVDFWYNHFNVWANKDSARYMVATYERDAIRPHALGNFKDLLLATAQSPAMLYYLDNFLSQLEPPARKNADGDAIPTRRPGLNENYARELMELHTLGVDGGYTQKDVTEVARCFTGWTMVQSPNTSFLFRPRMHDRGEKLVLGKRIPEGGGVEDGLRVLELLSKHPSTAKFISTKLIQRFVADQPPPALVERTAQTFLSTGGDIREVLRTILTSAEFFAPMYYRNKIKSPFELAASAIRAAGASSDGAASLAQVIARMGEPLYLCQPPTGYSEDSSLWLSNATLLERMNFAVSLVGNKVPGTRVDAVRLIAPDAVKDQRRLLDQLIAVLVHSEVSDETRNNLKSVVKGTRVEAVPAKYNAKSPPPPNQNEQLIRAIASLVLGSREFQVK